MNRLKIKCQLDNKVQQRQIKVDDLLANDVMKRYNLFYIE